MSPKEWRETMRKHRGPRASGDEPAGRVDFVRNLEWSPRERG